MHRSLPRLIAAIAAGGFAATGAQAQQADRLEEIIVTAEKREASIQDTPISITAFDGDQLRSQGLTGTTALADYTPGLTVQKEVIGKVVIRGIGAENFTVGSDPGVAIHRDGIYLARASVATFDLFDVQRVEVLRGPQGTLYGRNAVGGVINIISAAPEEELGGYLNLTGGNYSRYRLEGAVTGSLTDNITGRVSGLYAQRDGFTDNLFGAGAPDDLDDQDLMAFRGQVKFDLGNDASLTVIGEVYRDDSLPPAFKYFEGAPWFDSSPGGDLDLPDLREVSQGLETDVPDTNRSAPSRGKNDQDGVTVKYTQPIGDLTFTSLTGYKQIDFNWINDGDGFDQFFVVYFQDDSSSQLTQEFQLSNAGTDSRLQWLAGAYYLNEDAESFLGIPFVIGSGADFITWDGEAETNAYALFGQATWSFTDQLRATFGLRYNYEEKEGRLIQNIFGGVTEQTPGGSTPPAPTGPGALNDSWSKVTPRLVVEYDFREDVTGYASITQGFRSGGFNLLAAQRPFDQEEVWSYELGLKAEWLDGRLRTNVGGFYYDYTDLQVGKVVNLSARVENAAKATIFGGEAEVQALLPAGFQFNTSLAYLDTEYKDFITEDPGDPQFAAGDFAGTSTCSRPLNDDILEAPQYDLTGCELPRSPRLQALLSLLWEGQFLFGGTTSARVDYAWRDDQFFTQFNRNNIAQDAYGVLNARLGWTSGDRRYGVVLYGDNITEEDYFVTVLESGVPPRGSVVPQAVVAPPRTYGVQLNFNFGGQR
jgi:iron complex outermembrane recepter protein